MYSSKKYPLETKNLGYMSEAAGVLFFHERLFKKDLYNTSNFPGDFDVIRTPQIFKEKT